jgi:hypothetical protein
MKLAVLGVITVGIGVALGIPGLVGIGAWWIPTGLLVRAHGQRLREARATGGRTEPATTSAVATEVRAIDGKTFALGTVLLLAVGLPALAVGIFEIGIDADDAAWRWLPVAVGALTTGIAVISGIMYAAGAGVSAAVEAGGTPDVPATIWIRSVKETGTYVNERPRLEFVFHVEPESTTGVAAYDVTKKATVPFTAMGSLRVGDGFKALVAGPEKPASMTIHWQSPVSSATPADAGPTPTGGSADVAARLDELDRLRQEAKINEDEYQAQRQRILGSL